MSIRMIALIAVSLIALIAVLGVWHLATRTALSAEMVRMAYATPAPAHGAGGLRVFHMGHSLVGRDMPAMLAQLAGKDHRYESQLGWGASLKEHWDPDEPIDGFKEENNHPRFRPAHDAIDSGEYDAVVLTEMVEIRDAIKYHKSGKYFALWTGAIRKANPQARIYLYESWHPLHTPEGWLERLDLDLSRYWFDEILLHDLAKNAPQTPAYLIPAGQVMASFVRQLEARGGLDGLTSREGLFRRAATGEIDPIHINDLGAYLVALVHYAVLYQTSPVGLPHRLRRADGSPADAPSDEVAQLMQETVWQVVRTHPETGVPQ